MGLSLPHLLIVALVVLVLFGRGPADDVHDAWALDLAGAPTWNPVPITYPTSASRTTPSSRAAWNASCAAVTTLAPVMISARPTMRRASSITTAFVCVEPTSTPPAYRMGPPVRR